MPTENEKRSCTQEGCKGIQTYTRNADIANSHILLTGADGKLSSPVPKPAWAWLCNEDREHYELPSV